MTPSLLDTDTLSDIMKKDPVVREKAIQYLSEEGQFTFSLITRYEILRGLRAKQAVKQIAVFTRFQTPAIFYLSRMPLLTKPQTYMQISSKTAR